MTAETGNSHLAAMVERLSSGRVLVVGDVMLDRFIYGAVERISPEAPIPICRVEQETAMPGGAGNVARNLAALGAKLTLIGVAGDDDDGRALAALLDEVGGIETKLVTAPGRRTTVKTRYIAGGQQLLRADREDDAAVGPALADDILAAAELALTSSDALILSDYGKGVLGLETTRKLIATAKAAGVPVVVDPKGADYARYAGALVVTPNRRELAEATRLPTGDDDSIATAASWLIRECGIESVLATRGGDGMSLVRSADGGAVHLPAEAREVFDVSGAGDTVVATVGAALAAGLALEDGARLANVAAAIVVAKSGTAVAYAADIAAALHARDLMTGENKLMALVPLLDRIAGWRRTGATIGFTNGCFDLIHPGHVSLLAQARANCDRLVVGLNSDASIRRLKGEGRPVQTEASRAAVLGSLASVDAVVIFAEDTPVALIEAIRPDVLVKGADYTRDEVVGGDAVESWGGKVVLAKLEPGHSTTETIERLTR